MMVAYAQDPNIILAEPIKSRSAAELFHVYNKIYINLLNSGFKPLFQITDNECPASFQAFLKLNKIDHQLAPPYDHRTNPAVKAIDTVKSHFVTGLASVDPTFLLHLWCRLIPYAALTLNLLRQSNVNSNLSAYAQVHGNFDFNKTPLAPPGCRILSFESPTQRATWSPHGVDGWYIGPAM